MQKHSAPDEKMADLAQVKNASNFVPTDRQLTKLSKQRYRDCDPSFFVQVDKLFADIAFESQSSRMRSSQVPIFSISNFVAIPSRVQALFDC